MANENYVPTQAEIWDFLVGLKEATQSGFQRVEARFNAVDDRLNALDARLTGVEARSTRIEAYVLRVERRLIRMDDRLADLERLSVRSRLEDHQLRITRLGQRS